MLRTEARFPAIDPGAGHYESFYIKASRPGGGSAVWLRHTVHKRPGSDPNASLWLTVFDADSPGPRAVKATVERDQLSAPDGTYIKVGDAILEPGRAAGSLDSAGVQASWDLTFSDDADAFFHLPYQRLYDAPLPKTKFLSPHPAAHYSGTVDLDGHKVELDAWPGMVGHNWGTEHAERWVWVQAADLAGLPGSYFDFAVGRIKIGPWTTPWVGNGMLRIDGSEHRLGGFDKVFSTKIDDEPTGCGFRLSGDGVKLSGRVSSEARNFVGWVYADPKGPEHNTLNCSISDLELEIERKGVETERLEVPGAAAYEIGMRETDHGIPLQPFPDG